MDLSFDRQGKHEHAGRFIGDGLVTTGLANSHMIHNEIKQIRDDRAIGIEVIVPFNSILCIFRSIYPL